MYEKRQGTIVSNTFNAVHKNSNTKDWSKVNAKTTGEVPGGSNFTRKVELSYSLKCLAN